MTTKKLIFDELKDTEEVKEAKRVVIEVWRGMVNVLSCPDDVEVIIKDKDNENR